LQIQGKLSTKFLPEMIPNSFDGKSKGEQIEKFNQVVV